MNDSSIRFGAQRQALIQRLFPNGIPTLWCPALTHYAGDGAINQERMRTHLKFMSPWVKGFLIPGSTGEGWEMSDTEVRGLLDVVIAEIINLEAHLLIGILKTDVQAVQQVLTDTLAWLKQRTGADDPLECLTKSGVCGFTVCPPSGADLSQNQIRTSLESVLALGAPIALYQLPQVTQNEMSAETLAALSNRFPNFYLFKDTSGMDRAANAGFREVFLVRGAEGGYASHLAGAGGAYDGFLLSTANCFARELSALIENVRRADWEAADALSRKLTGLCEEVFSLAAQVPYGNAFTNANKAMDHVFAHGPDAAQIAPPRLHSGHRLPKELIEAAGAALKRYDLMPDSGYLQGL